MAKGTKRLTALLLVLALSLSLLPTAGLAAEGKSSASAAAAETVSQNSGTISTYAASGSTTVPYTGIQYSYAAGVKKGAIRYVSQNPKSKYFMGSKYWPSTSLTDEWKCKWQCKSADVSMMLSYLGINLLPKDIINSKGNGDNDCMEKDQRGAKQESGKYDDKKKKRSGLTFDKAMDNYLNGGGLYSPPMIRLYNEKAFKRSGQHFVLVVSKKSATKYKVLDPYQNDIWEMTIDGNEITRFKWGSKYYTSTFTEIYQYHLEQKTQLKDASKPKTMTEGSIFVPEGLLYGNETITKVTAGCYDMDGNAQSCCYATEKPNSIGYDLTDMSNKLRFSQLSPGIYKYVVQATTASGTKTYLSQIFTVLAKSKTVDNAAFYFDSGCNVKYCAVPTGQSDKNNVDICLTKNSESTYMRFKANYVGEGYYTLSVVGSGKYLTVYKSKNESGTRVIQNSMVKRDGQYWQILPTGNGNYYLVPKCATNTCLTLDGTTAASGTKLQNKTVGQKQEQSWLLRYVRPLISTLKNTSSGIQVKWGTVPNATGYRIYRKKAGETSWTRVKTISSGKTASWTDTKAKNGAKYTYAIRSVYHKQVSPASPKVSTYRVAAPTMLAPKNTGKGQITVSWKLNTKGTGYQICYATNKSFQKSKTVRVKGGRSPSKVLKGLGKGETYYIKVRAYKSVSDQHYYSAWSGYKKIKLTK